MKAKRPTSPIKAGATPRRSPIKPALRALPTKDSPQKRKAEESQQAHDEVTSDLDLLDTLMEPETPIKKRRLESPSETLQPTFPPVASSSRVTLDTDGDRSRDVLPKPVGVVHEAIVNPVTPHASTHQDDGSMDVDANAEPPSSSDESEDEIPPPRRFRPVYLDHKQWFSRDPRLNRIWKQAEKQKRDMVQLHGHPFEEFRPQSQASVNLDQLMVH
jgi:hypothetical protein